MNTPAPLVARVRVLHTTPLWQGGSRCRDGRGKSRQMGGSPSRAPGASQRGGATPFFVRLCRGSIFSTLCGEIVSQDVGGFSGDVAPTLAPTGVTPLLGAPHGH
eukprot:931052-Prorocentrum_minimum.AAC.1